MMNKDKKKPKVDEMMDVIIEMIERVAKEKKIRTITQLLVELENGHTKKPRVNQTKT